MSGLDKIAQTINQESQQKADGILAQAHEKENEIASLAAEKIDEYKKEFQNRMNREVQAIYDRFDSENRQQRKQALLKTRSMVIEDTIEKAKSKIVSMPEQEYFDFLVNICVQNARSGEGELYFGEKDNNRVPKDFEKKCNSQIKDGKVRVAGSVGDIEHGFLIKYGKIEQNCSIESIFETNKNTLLDTANSRLADKA